MAQRSETLLSRRSHSLIAASTLTQSQARADALVSGFVDHATDGYSLAAMVGGGLVYRMGRLGALALGSRFLAPEASVLASSLVRYGSVGVGFTGEVFTFEAGQRVLRVGIGDADPNLLRWSGENGLGRGLVGAAITLGSLKGAGTFVNGQNPVLQHLFQDSAMVLAHNVSGRLGITERPRESFAEQMVNAEATLWQMNAGMSLVHGAFPTLGQLDRSLDLSVRGRDLSQTLSFVRRGSDMISPSLQRRGVGGGLLLATAGNGARGEGGLRGFPENVLAMTMGDPPGPGAPGRPSGSPGDVGESSRGRGVEPSELTTRLERFEAFLREHSDLLRDFYHSERDTGRVHDAIQVAHAELASRGVNRTAFFARVIEILRTTEWEGGEQYRSSFSIVQALKRIRAELLDYLGENVVAHGLDVGSLRGLSYKDPLRAIVDSYRLDRNGGRSWGGVDGGAPRRAVREAVHRVRDLGRPPYPLSEAEKARPLEERLAEARQILRDAGVRVVTVLGAGRHGLALGDWVRMAAEETEKVGDEYVYPVMLGRRLDFVYELNVEGTYRERLPDRIINSPGRLGLRAVHPRLNEIYLALSDTSMTTLDSSKLDGEFTPQRISHLAPNATVIPAIKSVKTSGESIPEWILTRFAREGRFDLMYHFVLQSGLGFPREMMGGFAPEAPVNLRLDAISHDASQRTARLLLGDRSVRFIAPENGELFRGINRSIEVNTDPFVAAYWAFIKNFISPGVGYRFQTHLVEAGPRAQPQELSRVLDGMVRDALGIAEQTFMNYELPALRRGIEAILRAMDTASSGSGRTVVGREYEAELRQFFRGVLAQDTDTVRRNLLTHTTGIEDLWGCTRIRDMVVYQRLVWDLLEARGDNFERRLAEYLGRVRSQASSQNFAFGLLEPTILTLLRRGMILRRPDWRFTVEGITGLPNAERRWGGQPPFVVDTLRWVHPELLPRPEVEAHPSGMRHHALDVARDRVAQMEDRLLRLRRTRARRIGQMGPQDLVNGFKIGYEIVRYLRNDMKSMPPRDPTSLNMALNDLENGLINLERVAKELPPTFDHFMITSRIHPFLDAMQEILVHLRATFDANGDLTHWRDHHAEIQKLFFRAYRILSGQTRPSRP